MTKMDNDPSKSTISKEEGSNAHREDREAKRKARSNSGTAAPVPGAHASKGEHKSRSKSGKRSSDDSKSRSRSRKSDEKSDYRSSSRSSASVPGAQAELSSPRSRSKKDEKGKESRGSRAAKPGVRPSASSRDRSRNKSSGGGSRKSNAKDRVNEEGEPVVAAMIVEEEKEDEDTKKERDQARIQEMVAAETQGVRQQMEAENQRLREEMERKEAEREEKELQEKKKKRNMTICAVLFMLLIGGGVAAFFALQGGSSSNDVVAQTINNPGEETPVSLTLNPTDDPSGAPSQGRETPAFMTLNPTDDPSGAPTNVLLKYEQPGPIECERVAAGLPIDGEEEMVARSFDIFMEVVLVDGNDIDSQRVQELETKIEKLFVPDLIGCPRDLFDKRRLRLHHAEQDYKNIPNYSEHTRHLQSMSIRYAIAKSMVTVKAITDDACGETSSPNCSVVAARLDLTVRGEEEIIFIAELVSDIFPKDKDIRPDLDLVAPFDTIIIGIMRPLDPTPEPTIAPTGTASENPSNIPSSRPTSSSLSDRPITPVPTKSPTKSPTAPPSMAPTPTPPPTFAPQPGPSPAPTPLPTASPTKAATNSPTKSPTRNPSAAPSPSPSIQASAAPSPAPTSGPTSAPTFNPTTSPTSASPRLGFIPLLRQGMIFEQSSTLFDGSVYFPAVNAVDGNYESFSHTREQTINWWRANLQTFYGELATVNKVTVWNRADCCTGEGVCTSLSTCVDRLIGATVKLFGAGTDNLLAQSAPLTSDLIQTVDFGEVTGVQYVQVHLERSEHLNFAEIEVWGSIPNDSNNLGYVGLIKEGMYVEQSSIHSNYGIAFDAAFAIDGDYDTFFHTNQADPNNWWRANLLDFYGQLVTVNKVTVWNRANCSVCPGRLAGATVQLYGAGTDNLIVQSAPLTSALVQTVDFGEVTGVQYIRVHLARVDYLHFTEIEAWGKVP